MAIQLTVENGPHDDFLLFISELKASEELRKEYNALKRAYDGRLMSGYRDAKFEFIDRVLLSGNTH